MLIVTSAHIAMGLFMALVTQINLILHCVASSQTSLIYSFSGKPHLNPISLPFWLLLYSVFASQAFLKGSGCLLSPSAIAAFRELTITMSTNTHSNSPPPRVMWLVCLGWSMGCCAVTTCGLFLQLPYIHVIALSVVSVTVSSDQNTQSSHQLLFLCREASIHLSIRK